MPILVAILTHSRTKIVTKNVLTVSENYETTTQPREIKM
jgi:hypothetical protein